MTSVSFTEEMKGHVAFGEEDFRPGERLGREQGTPLMFHLRIETDDFDRFGVDPRHPATPRGWVGCEALGGRLAVERGWFNLFVDDPGGGKRMLYRLHFCDGTGRPLTLTGFKVVRDHRGLDLWPDTTTLYTRLLSGHVEAEEESGAPLVASGVLHIRPLDFARQLTTFRARGGSVNRRARALAGFAGLFLGDLFKVYGSRAPEPEPATSPADRTGPTAPRPRPGPGRPPPARPGDHLEHRVVPFEAGDGMALDLIHVSGGEPPRKGPVLVVHGAGVRANLFRSPVSTTFVEHLVAEGYDVWLENWRGSIDHEPNRWTLDQAAALDHPQAVKKVVSETGAEEVKAVIHCQGSTSFTMSAVAGLVPEVSTVVANAVTLHPVVPAASEFKIRRLLPLVGALTDYLNPQWGLEAPTPVAKALDAFVKLTHHECDNPVCKWSSFTYGTGFPTLWAHEHLNEETHEWLKDEFASVPISFFDQMSRCIEAGHLLSVEDRPELPASFVADEPKTDARFAFLAGERNRCFLPVSQKRSFDFFSSWRPGYDTFHVLRNYGHLDPFLGKHAAEDVYPLITAELDRGRG